MKKLIILGIFIGLIIALIVGFILLNSKPDELSADQKEKAISEILGRKPNVNPDIKTGNTTYRGKHVEFSYPAAAVIYEYQDPSSTNSNPDSEKFSFDIKSPRLILNYNAANTLEKKLEDIPAVKFRLDKSNGYASKPEKVDGVDALSFSKDRSGEYNAEKSLFILNNENIYTISITGSNLNDATKLYDEVIGSFSFK